MPAELKVALNDPGFLVGKENASIYVTVDDNPVHEMRMGQTRDIEISPGEHTVFLRMEFGKIKRESNTLKISVSDGETISVEGKYSRLWGKYKISA